MLSLLWIVVREVSSDNLHYFTDILEYPAVIVYMNALKKTCYKGIFSNAKSKHGYQL